MTVFDPSRGFRRTVEADEAGEYRVPLLPPGRYGVEFQAAGFAPLVAEGVSVRVGESVELDAAMKIGELSSSITVGAPPAAVEATRVHQAGWLESERIESLPINRRNYIDFALLSPGVVETNSPVDSADYLVPSVPQSGLGILGGDGSGNIFAIDGFNNSGVTGNMRPSVPQAAVQEFQVNRGTYSAEFGGGVGGAVNIVTRSGSDQLHGEVFGYVRQRAVQARNYFDPGKAAFTRVQSGASAGGPVRRKRSFWFAAAERLDRHESAIVLILNDPALLSRLTPSQEQLLGFLERSGPGLPSTLAAGLRPALTPTSNPLVGPLFASNSGAARIPVPPALARLFGLRLDPLRYDWTVSGGRAARELGFEPRLSCVQALAEFLEGRPGSRPQLLRESYDGWGLDERYIRSLGPLLEFLRKRHWRVECEGLENVPAEGAALLVSNHRGLMPLDAVMLVWTILNARGRVPRYLIVPPLKTPLLFNFLTKMGGVTACRENAAPLLEAGSLVGVFPEGVRGAFSPYRDTYRLRDFSRSAYARMAIEHGVPVVPAAIVGHAEICRGAGRPCAARRGQPGRSERVQPPHPATGPEPHRRDAAPAPPHLFGKDPSRRLSGPSA